MIQHWNTVIDYLSAQEQLTEGYDLAILAGNSLPYLADELIDLYERDVVNRVMLVGGIGHATPFLRENFKKMGIVVDGLSETEIYLDYFKQKYTLERELFLTEASSTNSGENARFSLNTVKAEGLYPKNVLLLQDPILQRRIKATFQKEWADMETVFTNYVPTIPLVKSVEESIYFEDEQLNGLWSKEYFLSLVLGEIPRLRNDEHGYGPKGRGYINAVELPQHVIQSYDKLSLAYGTHDKR
ncbi:hypothetical protein UAY_01328 [Enterococcus moraviensis ATCC BAA-383]|uniref:DUF218 domain-containing protein n=1 Tax=Enterococcus moraviensis ATCC BAA-383 TaxID=1158609 RepID=R2QZF6_9ENTE|nr:ElyC/SanA/YdcF family protein [Enterococcus moraviensis]EOI01920.1 hypothetical protein UAY_01328 [Enterococcus moraviensis ATCC BAA-383]EOT73545.1 hypothetical protein I586_00539 [Enterococcus moraviensis ATCC BAA-383]OJG69105.1 hypothetical protein RV09_GL000504 [Enterococcus moraviensis]